MMKATLTRTAEGYELTGLGADALFRTRAAFEAWHTKNGDVEIEEMTMQPYYDKDGITIYHGRCDDVLSSIAGAALILGDPCYGTTQLDWDVPADWPNLWPLVYDACLPSALQLMFSMQPFTTDLINSNRARFRYEIIYQKALPTGFLDANRRPLRAHENILVFSEKPGSTTYNPQKTPCKPEREHRADTRTRQAKHWGKALKQFNGVVTERHPHDVVFFSNGHGGVSDHETAKPLELVMWLVASYSNPGDLVIDPFMGSGPVLEACKRLGRRAIGIDIRESCCEIAARRLSQEVMQFEGAA